MADLFQQDNPMSGSQWVTGSMPASMLGSTGPVKVDVTPFADLPREQPEQAAPQAPAAPAAHRRQPSGDLWSDPEALSDMADRAANCGDQLVATMFVAARSAAIAHQKPITVRAATDRFLRHRPGRPNRAAVKTVCITEAMTRGARPEHSREAHVNRWLFVWTATSFALVAVIGYLLVSGMFLLPAAMQRINLQPLPVVDAQPPAPGPPPDLQAHVIAPPHDQAVAEGPQTDGMTLASVLVPPASARLFRLPPATDAVNDDAQPVAQALPPEAAEPVAPIIVEMADDLVEVIENILIESPPEPAPEIAPAPMPAADPAAVFEMPTAVDGAGQAASASIAPFEMPDLAGVVFEKPQPALVQPPAPQPVVVEAPPMLPQPVLIEQVPAPVVVEVVQQADEDIPTLTLTAPEPADGDGEVRFAPGVAEWINSPEGPWQSALWRDREKPQPAPQQPPTPDVPEQAAAILDRVFKPIQKMLDQQQ